MGVLPRLLDLVIFAWPTLPSNAFLGSQKEIDDFTFKLAKSKIEELNTISTTVRIIFFVSPASKS
jgi:predicted transcriptional regulator